MTRLRIAMTADRHRPVPPSSQEVAEPVGRLVAINASAFPISAAGWLTAWAVDGVEGAKVLELARLDADALLGRRQHRTVGDAIESIAGARAVLIVTPVYRGSYTGVLKSFFDLLPAGVLDGTDCLLVATGAAPEAPDGLEPATAELVTTLGGELVPGSIYVPSAEIDPELGIGAAALGSLQAAMRKLAGV